MSLQYAGPRTSTTRLQVIIRDLLDAAADHNAIVITDRLDELNLFDDVVHLDDGRLVDATGDPS